MVSALVFLLASATPALPQNNPIAVLDSLAQTRNVAGLEALAPRLGEGHFDYLRQTGSFGAGRFGWHVYGLSMMGMDYAIFSTPLSIQDYGEFIYEWRDGALARYIPETDNRGVVPQDYDISVYVDERQRECRFTATVQFRRVGPIAGAYFVRLSPGYRVSKIVDEGGADVPFQQAGGIVAMAVPNASTFKRTFTYSARPALGGYAGSFTRDEVMLTDDYWWPHIGRLPATTQVRADVPAEWEVVANGNRASQTVENGRKKAHFINHLAISYLSFSAGPYQQTRDARPQSNIIHAVMSAVMSKEDREKQLALQQPVVQLFVDKFGPWPFKGYTSLISKNYGGGGLEGYSYATYVDGWLPEEEPHEPAHTYFGGVIPNTYLNSFWNESFASFCEDFYYRNAPFGNADERRVAFVANAYPSPTYRRAPIEGTGALQGTIASDLGYGKGAKVLQMLEDEMGHEAFVGAVRRWIANHPKGEPGEWSQFEAVVGPDYKIFFDQYLRRPGWAEMRFGNIRYEDGQLKGTIRFEGDPYRVVMDMWAESPVGEQTWHRVVLNPTGKEQESEFAVDVPTEPVRVAFDPWEKIMTTRSASGPARLNNELRRLNAIIHPKVLNWQNSANLRGVTASAVWPDDLNGKLMIGHPDDWPQMAGLLERSGIKVEGNTLTYDGTEIDIRNGAAAALVTLPDGGFCGILIGETKQAMNPGKARIAVVDEWGRFLRGHTDPRTEGEFAFKL